MGWLVGKKAAGGVGAKVELVGLTYLVDQGCHPGMENALIPFGG